MKRTFTITASLLLFCQIMFSQTTRTYTEDEKTRLKLFVDLITYDTISTFDNAAGEAYYKITISSFKESLTIPVFSFSPLSANDKNKIETVVQALNQAKQSPPSWDDILIRQTQYQIWLDKTLTKKSKYKN